MREQHQVQTVEQQTPQSPIEEATPGFAANAQSRLNAPPNTLQPRQVVRLQRAMGNQAVQRMLVQRVPHRRESDERTITIPRLRHQFFAAVRQWIAGIVMSETDDAHREYDLTNEQSLLDIWNLAEHRIGQQVTITARFVWGDGRIEAIDFSSNLTPEPETEEVVEDEPTPEPSEEPTDDTETDVESEEEPPNTPQVRELIEEIDQLARQIEEDYPDGAPDGTGLIGMLPPGNRTTGALDWWGEVLNEAPTWLTITGAIASPLIVPFLVYGGMYWDLGEMLHGFFTGDTFRRHENPAQYLAMQRRLREMRAELDVRQFVADLEHHNQESDEPPPPDDDI